MWVGIIGVVIFQVDIWEERKVFGSRGQSLKDEMLGKSPSSVVVSNGKGTNPIKIVKKDAHSVRIVSIYLYFLYYISSLVVFFIHIMIMSCKYIYPL